MSKFLRNYQMTLSYKDIPETTVSLPIAIEIDISRSNLSSANNANIRIFNLNQTTRNLFRKDQYDTLNIDKHIILKAGYGNTEKLATVFDGYIRHGFSFRQGTNFVTQIIAQDGGRAFAEGFTLEPFPKGTPLQAILEKLVGSLPGVSTGAVGNYPGKLARGNTLIGSTTELADMLSGKGFFIDNGKAYCLGDDEYIQGDLAVISAESGLIGTPRLEENFVMLEMMFEPRLLVGQAIKLESSTFQALNELKFLGQEGLEGIYKVTSIQHKGMISDTVNGSLTTSVGLSNTIEHLLEGPVK